MSPGVQGQPAQHIKNQCPSLREKKGKVGRKIREATDNIWLCSQFCFVVSSTWNSVNYVSIPRSIVPEQ
jgi:hypothetical protein